MASQIYEILVQTSCYNYENYSWAEVETQATGNAKHSSEPMTWYTGQELELQDHGTHCSRAQGLKAILLVCASAENCSLPLFLSLPQNLAAERNNPHDHAAESDFPLGPAINLNEPRNWCTTSFHADVSMLRFLVPRNLSIDTSRTAYSARFER